MKDTIKTKLAAIRQIIRDIGKGQSPRLLILATYTREEFAELRPGEDYDEFKRQERIIAETLAAEGIADRVAFQEVDSIGFYHWLAEHREANCERTRAAYAAEKFRE